MYSFPQAAVNVGRPLWLVHPKKALNVFPTRLLTAAWVRLQCSRCLRPGAGRSSVEGQGCTRVLAALAKVQGWLTILGPDAFPPTVKGRAAPFSASCRYAAWLRQSLRSTLMGRAILVSLIPACPGVLAEDNCRPGWPCSTSSVVNIENRPR